ncbi:MAG TPA: sugar phosphate nucleotidyltransferase, partial [Polyangiaceae bacterium]|nr:sugar phosphate nucleotidyltransferase [Polyangiaceae bacterium]
FVITQYQSESLNRHVANTYKFDAFASGFIALLAAEQTEGSESDWFDGTADAVRKCMKHLGREDWNELVILSGDQLYRMSLREMLATHRRTRASVTVATKPVPRDQASAFGILQMAADGRIVHFDEKPPLDRLLRLGSPGPSGEPEYLASMGIYIFERSVLERALQNPRAIDFGKHVLPALLSETHVQGYRYDGYWEDVGTVRSYYEANLALTRPRPDFSFFHPRCPIYSERPFLPPSQIHASRIDDALVADGCSLDHVEVERAVIGIRSRVGRNVKIKNSLLLGADDYETLHEHSASGGSAPRLGVGDNSIIENAIIDKNARIGKNVRISNPRGLVEHDGGFYYVRDGIVIVPKGATVPDDTEI